MTEPASPPSSDSVAAPHGPCQLFQLSSRPLSDLPDAAMTQQYYCHVCEQNVNALDVVKSQLTDAQVEGKEPPSTSDAHHSLECEQCHQSYIEEVEAPLPTATAAPASTAAPVPASTPTPAPTAPAAQPQTAARMFVAPPGVNFFPAPPFANLPPLAGPFLRLPNQPSAAHAPFPFPFPFGPAQPLTAHSATPNLQAAPSTAGGPAAQPPFVFPFGPFPFPFPTFSAAAGGAQAGSVAAHPGNYAASPAHFNQLLSSFLHPIQPHNRGLAPALLARLPRRTVGASEEKQEACIVCQSDMLSGEEVVALPGCSHCFHSVCLEPWLNEHDLCPTCRKQVTEADLPTAREQPSNAEVESGGIAGSSESDATTANGALR